jgi:capsular exopolysaccharide synthesis family protein
VQGEGKSLTTANLALTFAESYKRRVLLIDADLRRPSQHTMFGVDNATGLTDLTAKHKTQLSVKELSPRLSLLTAGPPTPDPMAGLTSQFMQRLIEEAREEFDWVIVDTPPVVMLPDANLLGAMVDGAVLVLRAGVTPYHLVNRAVQNLGRDRILGVVLNGSEQLPHSKDYGYHYYAPTPHPPAVT